MVGGGQLAQMLAKAGKKLGVDLIVQTRSENDPAVQNANGLVLSDTNDINGTRQLAQKTSCITFENEWVDIEGLSLLEDSGVTFIPKLSAMSPLINKLSQRKLLKKLNIPGPEWLSLSSFKISDLKLEANWKFPLMAKSSFGGYDGKGTMVINDFSDLKTLLQQVNPKQWFLEKWINYDKELSLVVSRDLFGEVRTFPLVETFQTNQICNWVLAPADVIHPVIAMANNIAISLVRELNYTGVLAIEFFYGNDGLLVNEIAPRTHNSAHLSIEACASSQFEHQIAIAARKPVKSTELIAPGAIMVNLLGFKDSENIVERRLQLLKKINGVNLHWYNKENNIPGRKLGHVTKLLSSIDIKQRRNEALQVLNQIRSIWPMT
ncbi:Phosphoribosylaminoimidazole carboxylase ATPase subunit [Prochlorococcus sp. SS52]|nr:Phosphoribosylaminoimidazole carboxylase ATPase subunit [Prochlorococcus marinus str. LG]KGG35021.1 Phosphoribosylaminoimidazole carboxylase ATPase subunit [Prochlorococcus sp. SS52]